MKVQSYLAFDGNCLQALNFYSEVFDAEIINRETYVGKKIDVPPSYKHKLQHAELKGKGVHFMAYDASPDTPINRGNQIHMSVDLQNRDEASQLFEKLADGGKLHHKFSEREWGYFGRCTDKYGVNWMVNCTN